MSHSRRFSRRCVFVAAVLSTTAAAFGFGCSSGDDSLPVPTDASSTDVSVQPDVIVKADAAKPTDASVDANDAAALCLAAPDAAMYSLDDIDGGSTIVTAHGCKGCHTANLSGNLTAVSGAYPKNLTPDRATGLGCWTDAEIARAILFGIDDQGETLCVMPQFESTIGDASVTEVVAYLRSLPAVDKTIPETTCPSDAGDQ